METINELILLNGPPAVGKTTVAERWAELRDETMHIDVDELRSENWRENPRESGLAARASCLRLAQQALPHQSVIVSQMYGQVSDIIDLESVARQTPARFIEIVLIADRELLRERFAARTGVKQRDAALFHADFDTLYDRVLALRTKRPNAIWIEADAPISEVLAALDDRSSSAE